MTDWQDTVSDALKRRGMTRQQLARELGVNTTTVGRWLNGRNEPCAGTLRRIGAILGLNLIRTDPADSDQWEESELLDAFGRMPAAERRLLLQCLRERDHRLHAKSQDNEEH